MTLLPFLVPAGAAAVVYGLRHAGQPAETWQASGVKTASTALLALAGWWGGAPLWIITGLALGSLGDFALSRPGTRAFLAGMIAFALGHLAYVAAFVHLWSAGGGGFAPLVWPVLALMAALVVVTALWIAPRAGALRWPVRAYALVIGAMAVAAALLPEASGRTVTWIGVAMFVASDLILALRMFVLRDTGWKLAGARVLWPLYWGGQALILWGAFS